MKIISNKEKYQILAPDPLPRCSVWALVDQTRIDGSDQEASSPEVPKSVIPVISNSSDSSELSVIISSSNEEMGAGSGQKHIVVHEDFTVVKPSSAKQHVIIPKQNSEELWSVFIKDQIYDEPDKSEDGETLEMESDSPNLENVPVPPTTGHPYFPGTPKRPTIPRRLNSLSHLCRDETQTQEVTPPKIELTGAQSSPQPKVFKFDAPVTPKSRKSEEAPVTMEAPSPPPKRRRISKRHKPDYSECKIVSTRIRERRPYNIAKKPEPNCYFNQATREFVVPDVRKYFLSSLDPSVCKIPRRRYLRASLDELQNSTTDYIFEKNLQFLKKELYAFQWVRIQKDPVTGLPDYHTKCALCIYCKTIQFFNIKLSHFRNHTVSCHGVFPNGYLTPDPLKAGIYRIPNQFNPWGHVSVMKEVRCVACPVCYDLFEIDIWASDPEKSKLSGYLRHFEDVHRSNVPGSQFFDKSFKG